MVSLFKIKEEKPASRGSFFKKFSFENYFKNLLLQKCNVTFSCKITIGEAF